MANVRKVVADRWLPSGSVLVDGGQRDTVVWRGIPGESARVKVVHRGRNRDSALWISAHPPDPHRVEPPCDRMDPCGGCPLMHLDGDGQAAAQRALVQGALAAEGLDLAIGAQHPCPDGLAGYRAVAKVGFGVSDRGRLRVGAWGRRNRRIVPIPECPVVRPVLRKTMKSLAHHVITMGIQPYDPETDRGVLRAAVMRASTLSGHVLLTLVAGRRTRALSELADAVSQGVSELVGVWLHLNTDEGNNIYSRDELGAVRVRNLAGRDWIEERIGGVTYRIGPGDFFQTNPATASRLYARVLELLAPTADDGVLDLYCGVGGIALQAASRAGFVMGVETVEGAVLRARAAARMNRLNAEFLARDVLDALPELQRRFGDSRPLICVNPARRGLEEGVPEAIAALKPQRVVYVSCNPRALARDLAALAQLGLRPGPVELFDMFPNTAHTECVVALEGPLRPDRADGRPDDASCAARAKMRPLGGAVMLWWALVWAWASPALAQETPAVTFSFDSLLVATVQANPRELQPRADAVQAQLQQQISETVVVIDMSEAPRFDEQGIDARTYMMSCPLGQYTGCALVVGQRVKAEYAVGGTLAPAPGSPDEQVLTVHFVDVDASEEVVTFGVMVGNEREAEVIAGVAALFDRIVKGDFDIDDVRGDIDDPAARAQVLEAREKLIAASLDELEENLGELIRADAIGIVEPPRLTRDDIDELRQTDDVTPWERVGMKEGEFLRFSNSGLTLPEWRRRTRGRFGQLLIGVAGGGGGGPFAVHHEGRYLKSFDEATELFYVSQIHQYQEVRNSSHADIEGTLSFGVAPFLEIGGFFGARSSPITFVFDQDREGEPSIVPNPSRGSFYTTYFGARAGSSPCRCSRSTRRCTWAWPPGAGSPSPPSSPTSRSSRPPRWWCCR